MTVAASLAVLLLALAGAQAAVTKGQPAPNFSLKGLDGKTYQLSDFKGKRAVVVDFWATWCPPCQRELPELERIWKKFQGKPVQFLGVNVDGRGDVPGNVRKNGLTFPVLVDRTGSVGSSYGVQGIPTLVVIDKQGIVRDVVVGYAPDLEKRLTALLDQYSR